MRASGPAVALTLPDCLVRMAVVLVANDDDEQSALRRRENDMSIDPSALFSIDESRQNHVHDDTISDHDDSAELELVTGKLVAQFENSDLSAEVADMRSRLMREAFAIDMMAQLIRTKEYRNIESFRPVLESAIKIRYGNKLSEVLGILNSYVMNPSARPSWVPLIAMKFVAISAAIGTLDKLDAYDSRMADVVIRYFMSKDTLEQLKPIAEVDTPSGVRYVLRRAVDFLWDEMPAKGNPLPEFPELRFLLDKTTEFPRQELRRDRSERQREVARAQWEGSDARRAQRLSIKEGMKEAHDKMSDAQRRRRQRQPGSTSETLSSEGSV